VTTDKEKLYTIEKDLEGDGKARCAEGIMDTAHQWHRLLKLNSSVTAKNTLS